MNFNRFIWQSYQTAFAWHFTSYVTHRAAGENVSPASCNLSTVLTALNSLIRHGQHHTHTSSVVLCATSVSSLSSGRKWVWEIWHHVSLPSSEMISTFLPVVKDNLMLYIMRCFQHMSLCPDSLFAGSYFPLHTCVCMYYSLHSQGWLSSSWLYLPSTGMTSPTFKKTFISFHLLICFYFCCVGVHSPGLSARALLPHQTVLPMSFVCYQHPSLLILPLSFFLLLLQWPPAAPTLWPHILIPAEPFQTGYFTHDCNHFKLS